MLVYRYTHRLESLQRNIARAGLNLITAPVASQLNEQVRALLVEARKVIQPQGPSE
jgi:hypothetical protein